MRIHLSSEADTQRAGQILAGALMSAARSADKGLMVFVRGILGAGKSTLIRAMLRAAGVDGVIPSPTYTLVETYQRGEILFFHMDAYRLGDAAELDFLGIDRAFSTGSIVLLEWPERVEALLPPPALSLNLSYAEDGSGGRILDLDIADLESAAGKTLLDDDKWSEFG